MCGIAGFIGYKKISKSYLIETLNLMKNRGPDAQSYREYNYKDFNVYLLHSRLKIIDLGDAANQPITIGDYTLIFNGEIYNYIELKEKLIKECPQYADQFTTDSDCEVLIHLYKEYGVNFIKKCKKY